MSKNLDESGLKSIVNEYDLFFIDIWGVVHNGIKLYENAIKVLEELSNNEKKFILLTNAPRPNLTVINTLKKMGLNNFYDTVFTSGEASKRYLLENFNNKKFFHLGPPRDFDLFKTLTAFSSSFIPLCNTPQISMKNKSYSLNIDFNPNSSKFLLIFQI